MPFFETVESMVAGAVFGGLLFFFSVLPAPAGGRFDLPPLPPPEEYGNVRMDRASPKGVKPVVFSHWVHRQKFTCGVCHGELGFNLEANTTEVTEAKIREGRFCGACHNGLRAFRAVDHCDRCHSGEAPPAAREKFAEFDERQFPAAPYGNGIDWVAALKGGLFAPATFLKVRPKEVPFDRTLLLEAEWNFVPPAIFPHAEHLRWMGCDTCHPDVFNIKKKTTEHFFMSAILKGEFCGACHLRVAFPMDDCRRCHPGMD